MARGPIRHRSRTRRRDDLGPEPGLVRTTDGALVPLAPSVVPAAPTPVNPQALAQRWAEMEILALDALDDGVRGRFEDPAHQRERRQAAECILGFRRGGIPMPALMGALQDAARQEPHVIRLRWGNGKPVHMPLYQPGQRDDDEEDDDDA